MQSTRGFTIFETLIVLAVTTFLFMAAAITINGRQQRTDFQVGSRDLRQQIRDIVNQTKSGYYPNSLNFRCTLNSPNLRIIAGATEQGKNADCIYAGTALVFNPSAAEREQYTAYPLAGRRTVVAGGEERDVRTPGEAAITAVARTAAPPNNTAPEVTPRRYPGGLIYVGGRTQGASSFDSSNRFAITFMSSFSNFVSLTNTSSGTQNLELRRFTTTWSAGLGTAEAINAEASRPTPYGSPVNQGVEICFRSAGTNQSVSMLISSGLEVTNQVFNGVTCT